MVLVGVGLIVVGLLLVTLPLGVIGAGVGLLTLAYLKDTE
jgi:hypothetical protein